MFPNKSTRKEYFIVYTRIVLRLSLMANKIQLVSWVSRFFITPILWTSHRNATTTIRTCAAFSTINATRNYSFSTLAQATLDTSINFPVLFLTHIIISHTNINQNRKYRNTSNSHILEKSFYENFSIFLLLCK